MKHFLFLISLLILSSGCTKRLVDFTVISSKNATLNLDRSTAKQTKGAKAYFFGVGFNLKDALDEALEKAGPEYDLLVDGVMSYSSYPFWGVVRVRGLAVSSKKMISYMGKENYEEWLQSQENVLIPEKESTK